MLKIKVILGLGTALLTLFAIVFVHIPAKQIKEEIVNLGATILYPPGGGTGKGSATTTDIGSVLVVSSSNPFVYKFSPTSSLGITGIPGGSDTQVQFNNSGLFAGSSTFTFNSSTGYLLAPSVSSTNMRAINVVVPEGGTVDIWGLNVHGVSVFSAISLGGGGLELDQAGPGLFSFSTTDNANFASLNNTNLTVDRTLFFPDNDGTIALVGDNLSTFTNDVGFVTSSNGTVLSGTTGQFPYYAANGTTLTPTSALFLSTNGNIGINSSSPIAQLGIKGVAGTNPLVISSSTGANLMTIRQNGDMTLGASTDFGAINFINSPGGTEIYGQGDAGMNISTDESLYFNIDFNNNGNNAIQFYNGSVTLLHSIYEAGLFNWNTSSVANSFTMQGMSGLPVLGLHLPTGASALKILENGNVGFGTSTPVGNLTVSSANSTTIFFDSTSVTKGTCLVMKDADGSGYTYITANNGVLSASTTDCR